MEAVAAEEKNTHQVQKLVTSKTIYYLKITLFTHEVEILLKFTFNFVDRCY